MTIQRKSRSLERHKAPEGIVHRVRTWIASLPDSPQTRHLKREAFSKYVGTDTAPAAVRRARAIDKWLFIESLNEATNHRLLTVDEEYNILPRVSWSGFLSWCQHRVAEIIGETVPVDALIGSFSGGASTSRTRTRSHPSEKYLGKAHVTGRALDIFEDVIVDEVLCVSSSPDRSLEQVRGNVMFTVPKKTDIDRVACKEPDINVFMQKGIGDHIRRSLLSVGINLNDQSINRSFARRGSLLGDLCTLDLSSASDSVSEVLVSEMLPVCWWTALDSVRSHVTIIDGVEHRNEMFSSMGNGFTFELESLLFYVITSAVCYFRGISGPISVYGDDIIAPSDAYHDLVHVLGFLGFTVNTEKSFNEGPFRESCGGHYYNGLDITPFYVKADPVTLQDVTHLSNQIRKWAGLLDIGVLNPLAEDIWFELKAMVPSCIWGGDNLSDKSQLVSPDIPMSRWYEQTTRSDTGVGGCYHWLNATWRREVPTDGVTTSSRSVVREGVRIRPLDKKRLLGNTEFTVPRLPGLFLRELA